MHDIFLSVVMVVDHWAADVPRIVRQATEQLKDRVKDYEIVLVDNASGLESHQIYRDITAIDGDPNVQVFRLLGRVSYETAAWAGVENSLGDYVLVMEPFSETMEPIDAAITAATSGPLDLVLIVNDAPREHGFVDRLLRKAYRTVFKSIVKIDLRIEGSQYRLISKRVVSYLLQRPNPASVYRTLPTVAGFPRAIIHYSAPRRHYPGRSLIEDVRRGFRILISNSSAPLRAAASLSLLGAVLNVCYSLYVIVLAITRSNLQPGWITLSLQQSGMYFLWSLMAFVVTEYLSAVIEGQRFGTPYYVLDEMNSAVLTRRDRLNVETAGHETAVRPSPTYEA